MDVKDYIGIPFEYGARGDDKYDCFGLVRELYNKYHGILVKDIKSSSDAKEIALMMSGDLINWKEVDKRIGSVVLFKIKGIVGHVGFVVSNDSFIHTWEKSGGVAIERIAAWEKRIIGYYEYVG